jgi:hypothetical protein
MNRKMFLIVSVFTLSLFFAANLQAGVLFQDDFSDGNLDEWTHIVPYNGDREGTWSIVEDVLQIEIPAGTPAQSLLLETLELPDSYTIEFDTRTIIDGGGASIIGFYTHWSNWSNWVGHGYRPGRFYITETVNSSRVEWFLLTGIQSEADKYQWHHFKYVKDGEQNLLYFDDILIYDHTYTKYLSDNFFVLNGSYGGTHQFDNVVIKTLYTTIDDILTFLDESIASGIVYGKGPGKSGDNRLNAMRNMLLAAADLIDAEEYEDACEHLSAIYKKCDGEFPPPYFVEGDAVDELSSMIFDLMQNLVCE